MKDKSAKKLAFRTFVIRAWREDLCVETCDSWRFSLQDVAEDARIGFLNTQDMIQYVEQLLGSAVTRQDAEVGAKSASGEWTADDR